MNFDNVYFYHAHFGGDCGDFGDALWEERDEYGFIVAKSYLEAMSQIVNTYRDELMSVSIEYIGDSGIICIKDKKLAEAFRECYIKTHYGEDEEENENESTCYC